MFVIQLLAVALVLSAVVWRQVSQKDTNESTQRAPTPTLSTSIVSQDPTVTQSGNLPSGTVIPTSVLMEKPQLRENSSGLPRYPDAHVNSDSSDNVILTSSDDPGDITSWYESYIDTSGYSARSKVKTKTNGDINNVLVGAKKNEEIRIEITKTGIQPLTNIKVTRTTY